MKQTKSYAWWDNEKQEFRYIYQSELAVKICSTDYFKKAIEEGKGKILPVVIIEASKYYEMKEELEERIQAIENIAANRRESMRIRSQQKNTTKNYKEK